ncbi:hypothetical protein NLM59_03775 [Weeksellaceae bacterium KMM 9724]|uniref:hypothetical protein n=1 Tax=Profundicola chukchiensis TaxID=2961959 RepID=UPI002439557D|nr:hypothetical protein [Profundicola chukchiensis]MDG4950034.1 hypothetical protein [Profundicola chukchiensis]
MLSYVNGQVIMGSTYSDDGSDLSATIFIKDAKEKNKIVEYTFSKNGKFKIELQHSYDSIFIETMLNGYSPATYLIKSPKKNKTYTLDLVLVQTQILKDVFVEGKRPKYTTSEDTISYNVSRYQDGSERKIQDVIKKLPGIQLNDQTGEIKYKGKSIETVTLDGDNLFGFNYTLGTKNINVDMVEQIEAIDNYSENPLLKGIEQGGKVSLNLKLKKGKLDFSGSIDIGGGSFNDGTLAKGISTNIVGVTKSYKSFASLSYNNIGINNSPFDYFGYSYNIEQKEQNYFAEKIIPESLFSNLLEDHRSNINNQFFGNYNAIFKLNPKLSIKTNLYYLQDKITTNQLHEAQFDIETESFTTSDNTFITKKPQQYRGDLEMKYNTSKTSLLEYNFKLKNEKIETPTRVIQNKIEDYSSFLQTDDFYMKQDLLWTKKLSDKKALQLSILQTYNDTPQKLKISPSILYENTQHDVQESQFKKTFVEGKATYLGSGSNDKYTFTVGANYNNSPFESRLFNETDLISENKFNYTQTNIYNTGVYNLNHGKWQVTPSYSIRFTHQKLQYPLDSHYENKGDLIFEPTLSIKYTLNPISFLSGNVGFNQNTSSENYFFLHRVLTDNRTIITNSPKLDFQKTQRYNLLYFNNDLDNQFQLSANLGFQKSKGNFFTNSIITENTTQINYFYLPTNNSSWNLDTKISKYISLIESTLKLSNNVSISNFKNIINNSDLRRNKNTFLRHELFWKTAFDIPINFENSFSFNQSISKSENQRSINNNSWKNTFKMIVRPNKKWFFILSGDYYLPDTKAKNEQFLFIDTSIRYKPNSKRWDASFNMRNLTNELNFEQVQTSDYGKFVYRSNLLPRRFLLNLTWNF